MNKCIVEFLGTFFLVLAIGITVLSGQAGELTPFAIAGTLMVMIYAGGHISGAHYNPAVTFAVWLRGKIDKEEAIAYVIFQLVAAFMAALVAKFMVGAASTLPETGTAVTLEQGIFAAFLAELLFTFALAFVILNVATSPGTEGNSFYGLAIAGTVLAGALTIGWISGGSFNPAVTFGGTLMRIFPLSTIWVHLLAELAGGFLAAKVYLMVDKPAGA